MDSGCPSTKVCHTSLQPVVGVSHTDLLFTCLKWMESGSATSLPFPLLSCSIACNTEVCYIYKDCHEWRSAFVCTAHLYKTCNPLLMFWRNCLRYMESFFGSSETEVAEMLDDMLDCGASITQHLFLKWRFNIAGVFKCFRTRAPLFGWTVC